MGMLKMNVQAIPPSVIFQVVLHYVELDCSYVQRFELLDKKIVHMNNVHMYN